MEGSYWFLSFDGLDDGQVRGLQALIHPSNLSSDIEFPWSSSNANENACPKANLSSLNVHAPAFEAAAYAPVQQNFIPTLIEQPAISPPTAPYTNGTYIQGVPLGNDTAYYAAAATATEPVRTMPHPYANGQVAFDPPHVIYSQPPKPFNGDYYVPAPRAPKVSSFNLNPLSKPFMPSNIETIHPPMIVNGTDAQVASYPPATVYAAEVAVDVAPEDGSESSKVEKVVVTPAPQVQDVSLAKVQEKEVLKVSESTPAVVSVASNEVKTNDSAVKVNDDRVCKNVETTNILTNGSVVDTKREQNSAIEKYAEEITLSGVKQGLKIDKVESAPVKEIQTAQVELPEPKSVVPVRFSWADIVSKGQKPAEKVTVVKPANENDKKLAKKALSDQEAESDSVAEDNMALALGKHLFNLQLNYQPVLLQPRGIINRRNWCYINATLQALLACPPFYTLLRNLPLGPGVEREKSSTPVIDSMVKVAYEFQHYDKPQEELQVGQAFQPDFIYDMLRDLKSDCLKGQQEDAEEFLSFILNGMHEEMVKIIKNYEKKNHLDLETELKENGDVSDGEEEWQVIGSKHKGMVTRKVAEHKTPVSDLLGGQIKSFLTTSGSKTSASIQPFFTLQLDVQSDNVTSVSEALEEMTNKEPIQGYTCAKTKQEVEAFSHIALQKLPPTLILHLKRFVYNKNGGCKKVMKKTDYPITLEINKDVFSPDVKKGQRLRQYKLFAVMYHDGEEAVKGHYISDVYNHGSSTWIRCDDRSITAVTEEQVLSYSPPRVPYLLFYHQES